MTRKGSECIVFRGLSSSFCSALLKEYDQEKSYHKQTMANDNGDQVIGIECTPRYIFL